MIEIIILAVVAIATTKIPGLKMPVARQLCFQTDAGQPCTDADARSTTCACAILDRPISTPSLHSTPPAYLCERSDTPSTRCPTPECSIVEMLNVIDFKAYDFWGMSNDLVKAPILDSDILQIVSRTYVGKGAFGKGYRAQIGNHDVFLKIFDPKKRHGVKSLKDLENEFRTQYIASAFSWKYSQTATKKIAYILPTPVEVSYWNEKGNYVVEWGFVMPFLHEFKDSKNLSTKMEDAEMLNTFEDFADFINKKADLYLTDPQGFHVEEDIMYMTDVQLHPDYRLHPDGRIFNPDSGAAQCAMEAFTDDPKWTSWIIDLVFDKIQMLLEKEGIFQKLEYFYEV